MSPYGKFYQFSSDDLNDLVLNIEKFTQDELFQSTANFLWYNRAAINSSRWPVYVHVFNTLINFFSPVFGKIITKTNYYSNVVKVVYLYLYFERLAKLLKKY